MTADDDLNQRVRIAQHRIVETAPSEARAGEQDPVPEPVRKKVRFAGRVEEQIPEGTLVSNLQSMFFWRFGPRVDLFGSSSIWRRLRQSSNFPRQLKSLRRRTSVSVKSLNMDPRSTAVSRVLRYLGMRLCGGCHQGARVVGRRTETSSTEAISQIHETIKRSRMNSPLSSMVLVKQ